MSSLPGPSAWPVITCMIPAEAATLVLHLAAFDRGQFHDQWFAEHGIDCPPAIALSVPKRRAEYFFGRMCAQAALRTLGLSGTRMGTG